MVVKTSEVAGVQKGGGGWGFGSKAGPRASFTLEAVSYFDLVRPDSL